MYVIVRIRNTIGIIGIPDWTISDQSSFVKIAASGGRSVRIDWERGQSEGSQTS